jgi:hypothetical protein
MIPKKVNYLNNKDMLLEIHKSKTSFCSYTQPEYHQYDLILPSIDKINVRTIAEAKRVQAKRLSQQEFERRKAAGEKVKLADCEVDYKKILKTDVVFRIMTYDHIPLNNTRKKNPKSVADHRDKVNFPPFQHWKFDSEDKLVCVGKSHWVGGMDNGHFDKNCGQISNTLAQMMIKLCERYATRGNVRGYCVDTETEALTTRGWLGIDDITENDTILSFSNNSLKWSKIKSIYRGQYNGLMHYITSRSIDALITPEHKLVTARGLIKAELIKQSDQIIVMGDAVDAPEIQTYSNSFVELSGWVMTEGCYELGRKKQVGSISVYQNPTEKADRIRQCLLDLDYTFTESGTSNLCFRISAKNTREFTKVFPVKNLTMDFILKLTQSQRELLINTMVDGDGWRRRHHMSYCQKDKIHVDLFQALLTMSGKKSNFHYITDHPSFEKLSNFYSINIFSKRGNKTRGECLNFNGGLVNGAGINRRKGKETFPNIPTVPYNNLVWCPETEYGCFVARRNGKVYLTGNTYNDEMKGMAILQLTQIGLQFDESKSDNPFAYFTAAVTNSFVRVINTEKRNQNIRDDILEMNGMNPSYSRTGAGEFEAAVKRNEESNGSSE